MRVPIQIKPQPWKGYGQNKVEGLLHLHRDRLLKMMPVLADKFGFKMSGKILFAWDRGDAEDNANAAFSGSGKICQGGPLMI